MHEVVKTISASLDSQERHSKKALGEAEEKLKKLNERPRRIIKEASRKQKIEID